jgi:hypothetical protein
MSTEHTNNTAIPADQAPPATAALDQVAQDPMANIPAGLQKFMNQAETVSPCLLSATLRANTRFAAVHEQGRGDCQTIHFCRGTQD